MSNALALASVTAVLRSLLETAISEHALREQIDDEVIVSALPLDRIKLGDDEKPQLNLSLYHVVPNSGAGWNAGASPPYDGLAHDPATSSLALDLYYLLTAFGKQSLATEILLGYGMQKLSEHPILSRATVRDAEILGSGLAEQVELIKITPYNVSVETVATLWMGLHTNFRPSTMYQVSVVLIENTVPNPTPLPVLERSVDAQPTLGPTFPTLHEVIPPSHQRSIRMGEVLTLRGRDLCDDEVTVHFTRMSDKHVLELAPQLVKAAELTVKIPPDPLDSAHKSDPPESIYNPDNWQVGVYSVSVVVTKNTPRSVRTTNELPITLAPKILGADAHKDSNDAITLHIRCSPKVHQSQRVTLILETTELTAEPFAGENTDELIFKTSGVVPGSKWIRLLVDGVESILIDQSKTPPVFGDSERVDIP